MSTLTPTVDTASPNAGDVTLLARVAALGALLALVGTLLAGLLADLPAADAVRAGRLASGTLEVRGDDGWSPLDVGAVVPTDVELRSPDGAVVGLGGGRVELAATSTGTRRGDVLDLVSGTAFVRDDAFVEVASGLVTATGRGAWRLDAGPGRVGVYDGSAVAADAGGRRLTLAPGRQVAVTGDRLDGDEVPLRYTASDPFDARVMADAIAVDDFLDATGAGLAADYGQVPQTAAFYTDFDTIDGQVVAALRPLGFDADGDRFGPPAAVLTAAIVTEALVAEAGLTPLAAATEVDDARRSGAQYGLVTHLHDVTPSAVRAAAGRALTQRQELVAGGQAAPVSPPAPPTDDGVALPADDGPADDGGGGSDEPTGTPPDGGTDPGSNDEDGPTDEDGPVGGTIDDAEDVTGPIDDIVGEDAGEVVDDTGEVVDELVDDLGNTVGSLLGDQ